MIYTSSAGRATVIVMLFAAGCGSKSSRESAEVEKIRNTERERLRALVAADMQAADSLHTADFQLVNPVGVPLSKTEYLAGVSAGEPDYVAWEAGDIAVKIQGNLAVLRYRDVRFDVDVGGRPVHRGPMYHTNVYQRRGGKWQVVWSQASGVVGLHEVSP